MTSWDDVWMRLDTTFSWLAREVASVNPRARATSGRNPAAFFPFGAYLTFSRSGEPGVEDLVVSVDCKRRDSEVELTSDISAGDGYVLAEGPAVRVGDLEAIDTHLPTGALSWLDEVIDFIESNSGLVCAQLREPDVA